MTRLGADTGTARRRHTRRVANDCGTLSHWDAMGATTTLHKFKSKTYHVTKKKAKSLESDDAVEVAKSVSQFAVAYWNQLMCDGEDME